MIIENYKVGDTVEHHIHGRGRVSKVYPEGNVHVRFPNGSMHTNPSGEFLPKHLTKIKEHNMSVSQLISQISEDIDSVELIHKILGEKILARMEEKKQEVMNEISDKLADKVSAKRKDNTKTERESDRRSTMSHALANHKEYTNAKLVAARKLRKAE